MRERGELQRRGSPPGRGCTNERFCNDPEPNVFSRVQALRNGIAGEDSIGNSFVRGWPEPPGSPYGVGRISPPLFLLPNILAMPSSKRRSWLGSQPFRLFGSFALGNARFTGVSLGRIIVGVKTPTRNNEGLFRRTTATGLALLFVSIHLAGLRGEAHARLVQSASRAA